MNLRHRAGTDIGDARSQKREGSIVSLLTRKHEYEKNFHKTVGVSDFGTDFGYNDAERLLGM